MADSGVRESNVHPYATLAYANTLGHVGRPIHVPAWQTYVIAREWRDRAVDAMGAYPVACLSSECDLDRGLEYLRDAGMVSITLVVDSLVGPSIRQFQDAFSIARRFKMHYLVDERSGPYQPSRHHTNELRRAVKRGVDVRVVPLREILDLWATLYGDLISRHSIAGVQRFSRASFEALSVCEGLCTVAAFIGDELVSCHLWIQHENIVWSHLAATSELGYASSAAYAVYDYSIRFFSGRLINLGGAAGVDDAQTDGLARFKAGFSNRQHDAYLCGAVLDAGKYQALCAERELPAGEYFPAYRAPSALA